MSATTTQLLSSGQFCKLRYDTIPVKSASANVSFYTNNSKMPNFELWHYCGKWAIRILQRTQQSRLKCMQNFIIIHFNPHYFIFCNIHNYVLYILYITHFKTRYKKLNESRNSSGVAQRVPARFRLPDFITFGTWWWGCQPHAPAAFTPRYVPGTHFHPRAMIRSEGDKSLKKSSDTTGNRSRDRPTSCAAP